MGGDLRVGVVGCGARGGLARLVENVGDDGGDVIHVWTSAAQERRGWPVKPGHDRQNQTASAHAAVSGFP